MGEFQMPSLGADMEAGTLVEWKIKPGDRVKRGDVVAEIETDKGLVEVEIFESGIVDQLLIEPGSKLPVGTVLATIRSDGAEPAAPAPGKETPAAAAAATPARENRVRISPLARKLAAELGVDVNTIQGTGPGGAIGRADIERAATPRPLPSAVPARVEAPVHAPVAKPPEGMRRAIAAAMARANREIPHYHLATRIDMSRALAWLEAENLRRPIAERLLPAALLLRAVAVSLRDVPELNGFWVEERHEIREAVHLGLAISLRGGGLVAPAIHDAHLKNPTELMQAMRELIPRARGGHLRSSEMSDPTITVTNLGDLGVETVFGVIYPPQVALVGLGRILEQPWAENGMLGVRPVLSATLSADHRATDGHRGAQFLEALARHLQEPDKL